MGDRLLVKICGVTTADDARIVADAGADAIGINFFPKSPRYVTDAQADGILSGLPSFIRIVGVFVGESPADMVRRMKSRKGARTVQSHALWPAPAELLPFDLIVAAGIENAASLAEVNVYLERCRSTQQLPAAILVDARLPGLHGGTGRTAPWHLLADFRPGVPIILAGGLTPENVGDAIRTVRPDGVDVASGVESAPGRKDAELVRRFVERARSAAAELAD